MGSRFRYSGRTEYQSTVLNRTRRTVQLERKPSQRYGKRQSHLLREHQKNSQKTEQSESAASPPPIVTVTTTAPTTATATSIVSTSATDEPIITADTTVTIADNVQVSKVKVR